MRSNCMFASLVLVFFALTPISRIDSMCMFVPFNQISMAILPVIINLRVESIGTSCIENALNGRTVIDFKFRTLIRTQHMSKLKMVITF